MMTRFQCVTCGEVRPSAFRRNGSTWANCLAEMRGKLMTRCPICGNPHPFVGNHVHGRRVSNVTVIACLNCHAKIHSKRDWRGSSLAFSAMRRGGSASTPEAERLAQQGRGSAKLRHIR